MTFRHFSALLPLALALLAPRARAAEPTAEPSGLYVNGHAGFGVPFGRFTGDSGALGIFEVFNGAFPVAIEAGYRFGLHFAAGVHAEYAFPYLYGRCPEAYQCDGGNLRLGLDGYYHVRPTAYSRPWFSLSLGYEQTRFGYAQGANRSSYTYSGWDLGVRCGADYPTFGGLEGGPFLGVTGGIYDHHTATLNGETGEETLRYRSPHFWIHFGFRLALEPVKSPQRR